MTNPMRNLLAGACLFFAAAPCLCGQGPSAELFGGYTYTKANPLVGLPKQNLNGWVAGVSGYVNRWFGVGVEIATMFGSLPAPSGVTAPSLNLHERNFLAGPQLRVLKTDRVQVAGRLMLGGAFGQAKLDSATPAAAVLQLSAAGYSGFNQTKFAMMAAVPVDVSVTKLLAIRVEPGWYLTDYSKTKVSNFRFSVGPVLRFGGR
jgi:hypothetical protein